MKSKYRNLKNMEPTSTEITRIHLPSMVDDKLDLAEINQRLREKKAELDWSGVVSAPSKYLEIRLKDLDRKKQAKEMGIEGDMLDSAAADLQIFFRRQDAQSKSHNHKLFKSKIRLHI